MTPLKEWIDKIIKDEDINIVNLAILLKLVEEGSVL